MRGAAAKCRRLIFRACIAGSCVLGGASLIRCVVLLHFNPLRFRYVLVAVKICAEFTPVPDLFDESAKTARGEGTSGRAAFLGGV